MNQNCDLLLLRVNLWSKQNRIIQKSSKCHLNMELDTTGRENFKANETKYNAIIETSSVHLILYG